MNNIGEGSGDCEEFEKELSGSKKEMEPDSGLYLVKTIAQFALRRGAANVVDVAKQLDDQTYVARRDPTTDRVNYIHHLSDHVKENTMNLKDLAENLSRMVKDTCHDESQSQSQSQPEWHVEVVERVAKIIEIAAPLKPQIDELARAVRY